MEAVAFSRVRSRIGILPVGCYASESLSVVRLWIAVVDCAELPVRCTQNSIATSAQNSDRCTGGVCGRLGDAHCSAGLDVQEMNWRSECWREVPSIFAGRENLWLAVVNLSHPLVSFASQEDVRNNCGGGISLSVFPVNPVSWK